MKKNIVKMDVDKLNDVTHRFKRSLNKIVKEFLTEIDDLYGCIIINNNKKTKCSS